MLAIRFVASRQCLANARPLVTHLSFQASRFRCRALSCVPPRVPLLIRKNLVFFSSDCERLFSSVPLIYLRSIPRLLAGRHLPLLKHIQRGSHIILVGLDEYFNSRVIDWLVQDLTGCDHPCEPPTRNLSRREHGERQGLDRRLHHTVRNADCQA